MYRLAIVGRPNVGKSALFNRICKERIAIVDEAEGVTRDRLYGKAEIFGFPFEVIDTGGIDPKSPDQFQREIRQQAEIAIEEADSIILVVDRQIGPTALDEELARILLKIGKPLLLAVNKVDQIDQEIDLHAFYGLGIEKMLAVSAVHGFQVAELLERAWEGFTPKIETEENVAVRLTVIGRPNVGKSTLINAILQENRCVVSPIAGTTRDSVDIPFTYEDKPFTLIDTAGIRRKSAEHETVDKFAALRTERALKRSDVCLLMLDARSGITTQEKRMAKAIEASGKGCILLLNKWDLVKGYRMEHCLKALIEEIPFFAHCPVLTISAKEGRNLNKIFEQVACVASATQMRISTHQLNVFVEKAIQRNHPPMLGGKRLRIYYMTQVGTEPPKFILFVNRPDLMLDSYKRYLINQFRERYGFAGAPIELYLKPKKLKPGCVKNL